ncbi:MAG: bifunctional phosphoglucose/phosphomannose isomerase [Flavobacteriales bacterium]
MNMRELVDSVPRHITDALNIGINADIKPYDRSFTNILIAGLGGSGIGGKIISQLVADDCKLPIVICNDYFLPTFVDDKTLVIACSYSGNTEETLSALDDAKRKGASIAAVTSGGKLAEMANANNYPHIVIPSGNPPRAMLAYSITSLLFLLEGFNLVSEKYTDYLGETAVFLENNKEEITSNAKHIAAFLHSKTPVLYADAAYEGLIIRWRQQINENAKMLCWHHVLPEMNHNELVGWAGGSDQLAVLLIRDHNDYKRTSFRMETSKEIFFKYTPHIYEVFAKGENRLAKTLYLSWIGDWVSVYLSDLKGVDPTEVKVIDHLKGKLSRFD